MSTKFSRNLIIGVSFIIALALLYFGLNFLKGSNVLKKQRNYIVVFEDVTGLNISSPIFVNGYQIGLVNNISMLSESPLKFAVGINLKGDYKIPKGSHFEFGTDFLGASTVSLIANEKSKEYFLPGDTLKGSERAGMMNSVADVIPKAHSTLSHLDTLLVTLNELMDNPMWRESLIGMGATVGQLNESSKSLNTILASLKTDLPALMQNLGTTSSNLKNVSTELNSLELQKTFSSIDNTVENLKMFTGKLNSKDNSLGKLTNDTQLHDSLTNTIQNATKLLEDIRQNPGRYLSVKVRLF